MSIGIQRLRSDPQSFWLPRLGQLRPLCIGDTNWPMNDSGKRDYPAREALTDWSDERLVTGLKAGDDLAAETMVRTHSGWMLAVARRILKDDALAEDCVQEAFFNAFQKISDFEAQSRLKTWLHSIVVNQSLMKLRARKRYQEGVIDRLLPEFDQNACRIEGPWTYLAAPHEILEREETRQLVLSKISELPDSYRTVLLLRDIEEMTTREVARALRLTEENVKVRLHRARSALKKLLEPELRGLT